jgi:mono/diheme cytochrome c family protein
VIKNKVSFNTANLAKTLFLAIFVMLANLKSAQADTGEQIFKSNCASCHHPLKKSTGPALQGITGRAPSKEWLYKWVHNSGAVIASGDAYAKKIYDENGHTPMTAFPQLSTTDIDAVIAYVETYKAPVAEAPVGGGNKEEGSSNNFFYLVITGLLAVMAIALTTINKKLHKVAAEKVGHPIKTEIPWYRHKLYIAGLAVIGFILLGMWMTRGGMKLGRQENYKPKQPIYYSHKVHAGINQINCQYCHSAAEKGKHAMIPSVNVCMNCHKGIREYTGAGEHPLVSDDGDKVNGTAEIAKVYKAAGWDPIKGAYTSAASTIPWVKIHNLPDHVAFSHATHVKNGKVACQRCHGPVQEMDEVYQFSNLSMGFCINCHREQKVQFTENNYYNIYKKFHEELKAGTRDSVTVQDVGGTECAKCHY